MAWNSDKESFEGNNTANALLAPPNASHQWDIANAWLRPGTISANWVYVLVPQKPGYEYQFIDDANYIYQGKKLPQQLKTASIYDAVAADKPDVQMGVWHRSRIRVQGDHLEHWLDGKKVVDVDRKWALFQQGVSKSKFHAYPGFAQISTGHILLQVHGHNVAFKNLKIRQLP